MGISEKKKKNIGKYWFTLISAIGWNSLSTYDFQSLKFSLYRTRYWFKYWFIVLNNRQSDKTP